jgi:hypothetical protein
MGASLVLVHTYGAENKRTIQVRRRFVISERTVRRTRCKAKLAGCSLPGVDHRAFQSWSVSANLFTTCAVRRGCCIVPLFCRPSSWQEFQAARG